MLIDDKIIQNNVQLALQEDIGAGDITALLIDADNKLDAMLICREQAVLCGQDWFEQAFLQLDPSVQINWLVRDSDQVSAGQNICRIQGNARAMLSAERSAINFLQTLSATATVTRKYQQLIKTTACRILDTRKTIPGLRLAQKYAVSCGGGMNHRIGLFDAFLLKENHLAAAGSIQKAVERARALHPEVLLEVEVENLQQLEQALAAAVDRVLLDNFDLQQLKQAVAITQGRIELEASGNITLDNILEIAQTGIDFISIGALTKHVQAIDFSLRFTE
jgi:nicotinate-nucleotide pyrophosphorylase (carboxylating)